MKIKINYNLLNKIKESKQGLKLYDFLKEQRSNPTIHFIVGNIVFSGTTLFFMDKKLFLSLSALGISILTSGFLFINKILKFKKDEIMHEADKELDSLCKKLANIDVFTTVDLLKECEVIEKHPRLKLVDKIPRFVDETYIDIPLKNGYNETILQEHVYGDKDYEISVKLPDKKISYKLARSAS